MTMTTITLTSPTIIKFGDETLQCKISHQMYTDNKLGVKLPVNYSLFMVLTEKDADGKFIMPIDGTAIFGKEVVQTLNDIKATVGQCSQIGEILFGRLKNINNKFKQIADLTDVFATYEERYYKLDFIGHRNLLSDIFKSNKLVWLTELLKEYDVKSVTKSFYNFIMDRNKYTHGELMYWYPDKQTLLEYENEARQTEYGIVNSDILNSYLTCYKNIDELLNKIDANLN
jgi:hypothetical protein